MRSKKEVAMKTENLKGNKTGSNKMKKRLNQRKKKTMKTENLNSKETEKK